jgi:hypothetical protein
MLARSSLLRRLRTHATLLRTLAASSVLTVLAIPGFAQTNTSVSHARYSSLSATRVYEPSRAAVDDSVEWPPNFDVPSLYRPIVDTMLRRSATFRRQAERIRQAPFLTVAIENSPPPSGTNSLAWTRISRDSSSNRIQATILISPRDRLVELLAHEIEHVIEQLDGVDLHVKSRLQASGVRHCNCADLGAFETRRAIVTGQRVAREVDGRGP